MLRVHAAIAYSAQHRPPCAVAEQHHIIAALLQPPAEVPCACGRVKLAQQSADARVPDRADDRLQLLCAQKRFVLRLAQVKAVAVDEFLRHGVDQVRDVAVGVHRLTNAGRADLLQLFGQCQLHDSAVDAAVVRRAARACAAEDDMVEAVNGIRLGRLAVGGGVRHHVAADHDGDRTPRQRLPQLPQVFRVCDVDRKILRENVDVKLVCHGHRGDLSPDAVGLGALGP